MRPKPHLPLGQLGPRERGGQALKHDSNEYKQSETYIIAETGKSTITGCFFVPKEQPQDIVVQITKLMAYVGTFDGLDI
jgi:hypothetical protein